MSNKEEHIKIGLDRHITVPEALRRIAVQYDHNIETVTFDCPRFWDGHDLSKMTIYINYMRKDRYRDKDVAENIKVDESDEKTMHFTWTVSRNATLMKGELKFLTCAVDLDDKGNEKRHWNSELCDQVYVTEGLECDDAVEELHADIITDLLLRMDKILVATTPILDKTLTERGLAADAKATGDAIDAINQDLNATSTTLAKTIRENDDDLAKAISTETASRKAEIDVERKRIDKFVSLKAGSTTGDAELMDARIGANGVLYDTLGDAVRSQFETITNSSSRFYRFDIGGIANTLGTVSANRTRIRTVLPYLEPEFTITNFALPENVQKATVLGLKNDVFVADLYSCLTIGENGISFILNRTDVDIDAIGISFQHSDGSEFTVEETQASYIEYRTSYKEIDKFARNSSNNTMMTGKLKRGVVGVNGVFTENGVALSTDFIECRGDEFTLLGMTGYLFLRCVGRDVFGNYSSLNVYPEEGGYRVHTTNIDAVAFSFYKGIVDESHMTITDEDYEAASFSYTASFDDINDYISDVADELRSSIANVEEKVVPVSGSKFVSIGDSITYGFIPRNSPGYPGKLDSYAALTAAYYNMEFVNHGVSGSTVAYVQGRSPMCERVIDLPDDADVVTFMGGTNDIRNGVNLGTMSDRTKDTFYGALHIIMSTLYEKYIVDRFGTDGKRAKIVICTPIKLLDGSSAKQEVGEGKLINLEPWVDAIKEVARYYSLPVLDFYNVSRINPHLNRVVKGTDVDYNGYYNPYITDGTHPNKEGAQLMSEALISFIKTI